MKILIAGTGPSGYQFKRLKEEGEKRGHVVERCYAKDLVLDFDDYQCRALVNGVALENYDLVRLQSVERNSQAWYVVADHLSKTTKTKFVDGWSTKLSSAQFSMAGEYLSGQSLTLSSPRSVMVRDAKRLIAEVQKFDLPCVVKTTDSRKGRSVGLVRGLEDLTSFVAANPLADGASYVLRDFIPNDGDLRILVIGGQAIGAMKRTPKAGEFRANVSQGGSGEVFDLTSRPDIQTMAEKITAARHLDIAGVDVIINSQTGAPYLLEVNDSPQIQGFERFTGLNAAGAIIEHFERLITM